MNLLNCPFCGGNKQIFRNDHPENQWQITWWVSCACGIKGNRRNSEQEAAEAWNKRAQVKLEYIEQNFDGWSDRDRSINICLGRVLVGEIIKFKETGLWNWYNHIQGGCEYAIRIESYDQAKADCEASVRKSLEELI